MKPCQGMDSACQTTSFSLGHWPWMGKADIQRRHDLEKKKVCLKSKATVVRGAENLISHHCDRICTIGIGKGFMLFRRRL